MKQRRYKRKGKNIFLKRYKSKLKWFPYTKHQRILFTNTMLVICVRETKRSNNNSCLFIGHTENISLNSYYKQEHNMKVGYSSPKGAPQMGLRRSGLVARASVKSGQCPTKINVLFLQTFSAC